jgi:hypothetical protein
MTDPEMADVTTSNLLPGKWLNASSLKKTGCDPADHGWSDRTELRAGLMA